MALEASDARSIAVPCSHPTSWALVVFLIVTGVGAGLFCASGCLAGGGIDCLSSASKRARMFVSTSIVGFSCWGVVGRGCGRSGATTSMLVPIMTGGGAGFFFLGRGVGEGSVLPVGWDISVVSRPRSVGGVEIGRLAARGG